MEQISLEKLLVLPKQKFISRVLQWMKEFNDGEPLQVDQPGDCPLAVWVAVNNAKCHNEFISNTAVCPLCGSPCCPACRNHVVDTISRVTGYLSSVSGWNEAKKQEFKDRNRYELEGRR